MITVGMNYSVLPGKETTFEKAFERVLSTMKEMQGHSASQLYRQVGDHNNYLIVSEWSDTDAFQSFVRSEAFAKVTNWGKEQILAGRPSHKIYKE